MVAFRWVLGCISVYAHEQAQTDRVCWCPRPYSPVLHSGEYLAFFGWKANFVIAHPAPASDSPGRLADITNRTVSSTEARLAFAVLTTERKAA